MVSDTLSALEGGTLDRGASSSQAQGWQERIKNILQEEFEAIIVEPPCDVELDIEAMCCWFHPVPRRVADIVKLQREQVTKCSLRS